MDYLHNPVAGGDSHIRLCQFKKRWFITPLGKHMGTSVRPAEPKDVDVIALIHSKAFTRQKDSETWVRATLAAYPRILAFVLEYAGAVEGYIFWAQKSGLRRDAVVELDQIAVSQRFRGQGFGGVLIEESFAQLKSQLGRNGQEIKSVLISTRADNEAQRLYEKVLGARVVTSIENLYSATEVIMIAELKDP